MTRRWRPGMSPSPSRRTYSNGLRRSSPPSSGPEPSRRNWQAPTTVSTNCIAVNIASARFGAYVPPAVDGAPTMPSGTTDPTSSYASSDRPERSPMTRLRIRWRFLPGPKPDCATSKCRGHTPIDSRAETGATRATTVLKSVSSTIICRQLVPALATTRVDGQLATSTTLGSTTAIQNEADRH